MSGVLRLPAAIRAAIAGHAQREAPLECCGFLLGAPGRVNYALPATNTSTTPETRYRVDPREHIALRRILRRLTPPLAIVGVYHSHPHGPNAPSVSDVREAYVRDWAYVIVDLSRKRPRVTCWMIRNGRARRWPLAR
jgi:proteasome lid subunit RPN8/RPN11